MRIVCELGLLLIGATAARGQPGGGGYTCCWGVQSCDDTESTARVCDGQDSGPPNVQPGTCNQQALCEYNWCNGGGGSTGPGHWCPTGQSNGMFDENLRLPVRPPPQTPDQAEAMRIVRERAVKDSAEARPWVLQYFDSHWFRQNLDPSLQHYSAEQLLEMYTWEFVRLPLIHNAPKDDWDVDRCGITDDSPLNLTLANGNLQQPCQRYVLGGPEDLFATIMYGSMYTDFHLPEISGICELTSGTRQSNNCMMYNANNLKKTSFGNTEFGSVTYVLNTKALAGRTLWEPIDGGLFMFLEYSPSWLFRSYPSQGTIYPPAFYHLLQPHEQLFGGTFGGSGYKTIATVFNWWWVDGAPFPTGANTGSGLMDGNPYFVSRTIIAGIWVAFFQ